MRKTAEIILAILSLPWAAAGAEMAIVSSGRGGLELELGFQQPETTMVQVDGARYHRVRMAGCHATIETGKPSLPQKSFMIALPPNHAARAEASAGSRRVIRGVRPAPAPGLNDGTNKPAALDDCYRGNGQYPRTRVVVSEPSRIGRLKVATVTVFPASYAPRGDMLAWHPSIRVSISFVPAPMGDRPAGSAKGALWSPPEELALGLLANREQASEWACLPAGAGVELTESPADTLPYKLLVRSEGIHRVGFSDLASAGVNPSLYDPRTFRLYHRGREEAIYFPGQDDGIFDPGDYFEFMGRPARGDVTHFNFHTDDEVYYLGMGGAYGARMVEEDAAPASPHAYWPPSFGDTLHLEQDSSFVRLKRRESDQTDRWFWKRIDQGDSLTAVFDLPGFDPSLSGTVAISIGVHGYTYIDTGAAPDHGISASLNGYDLGPKFFDSQAPYTYQATVPAGWCQAEGNRLAVGHAPVPYSIDSYLLNWIDVSYPRRYRASGDRIAFFRPEGVGDTVCLFSVGGFTSHQVDIYKTGLSRLAGVSVAPGPTGLDYTATFEDRTFGAAVYQAVAGGGDARLRPSAIIPNRASDLRSRSNRGDYLIIAPDTLRSQGTALAAQRAAQFPSAKVALTSDIYDEFGHGLASDSAVKEFIGYAYDRWSSPPSHVLLMGEGTFDPKNLLGNSRPDLVPAHFTRTDDFGPVADDNWYACVSGPDQLPDIAVGRLAVSTVPQYAAWEAKRNFYENQPLVDQWRRDFMVIAGWPLQSGDDFYAPSDELAGALDPRFTVSKVYHGREGGTTQDIVDQFNEGSAVGLYYGHGGGQVWSHSTFFTNTDVPRLNNWGRWPFVTAATCYCGAFDVPDTTTLAQELLRAQGGAVGVLASSGPSWGNIMEWTFAGAVDRMGLRRFGDITLSAKYQLSGGLPPGGYVAEMMSSFNLLGDPGMSLALADTGLRPAISPASVAPGDSLGLLLEGPFPASSVGLFSLADSTDTVRLQRAFTVPQAGSAQVALAGDSGLAPGDYRAWVYLKQGARDWAAATGLGVGRPAFSGFRVEPSRPTDLDSIMISATTASPTGIDSAWCQFGFGNANDTLGAAGTVLLAPSGGDTFVLAHRIAPSGYQPYLNYRLALADTLGQVWRSGFKSCRIWKRPDPLPDPFVTPVAMGGDRRLSLFAWIRNRGEMDAIGVPVHFYLEGSDSLIGAATVDTIRPDQVRKAELAWPHGEDRRQVYVRIDPAGAMTPPDQDTSNNRSLPYPVPPEPYLYRQLGPSGGSGDTVTLEGGRFRWHLPDSCLADSAVAFYGELTIDQSSPYYPWRQPGLGPLDTTSSYPGLMVGLCDSSLSLAPGRWLSIAVSDSGLDTASNFEPGVYRYDPATGRHAALPSVHGSGWFSAGAAEPGLFSVLLRKDTTGPAITSRVDRRATGWGNYVRTTSQLYHIMIEDPDGVDPASVRIRQDGGEAPPSSFSLDLNPADPRAVPVLYSASLGDGHHVLEFEAADLLGNQSTARDEVDILVSFGLYETANYPNPVDGDLTTFYFFVGDHADRWRTDIYTIAGRHVRAMEGGYASGVHTFVWDLTDGDGRRLANGVYFYVMSVSLGERTEKRTGKLAILR